MFNRIVWWLPLLVSFVILAVFAQPINAVSIDPQKQEEGTVKTFVPTIRLAYSPALPALKPIDNNDLNNAYKITWDPIADLDTPIMPTPIDITIEESTNPEFIDPVVHQVRGSDGEWAVSQIPGTYYYRARSSVYSYISEWSETVSVTIYPLFVGLNVRWDGVGYARGLISEEIGWHGEWKADWLTEDDTIQIQSRSWYDPNPLDLDRDYNTLYYSATTGAFRASNVPDDPSWKWGFPKILRYELRLTHGQTFSINNQAFRVRGPYTGYTTYGHTIQYWELVNEEEFTIADDGMFQQRVDEGDVILRYHAGNTRLLLYSDVKRHIYEDDEEIDQTVQYIMQLSSSNALPHSPGMSLSSVMPYVDDDKNLSNEVTRLLGALSNNDSWK